MSSLIDDVTVVRYWWLKLTALAEKDDWEEMEKFAKSKKSPIGYLVCCLYNLYTMLFIQ